MHSGKNLDLIQQIITTSVLWDAHTTVLDLDVRAYLLRVNGILVNDVGFLFYGQNSEAGDAANLDATWSSFVLDLSPMPLDIERVALALTIEQGIQYGQRSEKFFSVSLLVSGDREPFEVILSTRGMQEAAVVLVGFQRRSETWRFRALGKGFNKVLGAAVGPLRSRDRC
jgi:stress response protein SCP2